MIECSAKQIFLHQSLMCSSSLPMVLHGSPYTKEPSRPGSQGRLDLSCSFRRPGFVVLPCLKHIRFQLSRQTTFTTRAHEHIRRAVLPQLHKQCHRERVGSISAQSKACYEKYNCFALQQPGYRQASTSSLNCDSRQASERPTTSMMPASS